jgi:hypothetical protein
MTRRSHILLFLLAMALMAFAGAGCVEPLRPYEKYGKVASVQLPIQINLPALGGFATKGSISGGEVTGTANESALHSLQVWAFSHPLKAESAMSETERAEMLNEGAIAYMNIPDVNVLERIDENASVQVNLLIPDYYLNRPDEELRLDFYALGNGESVGMGDAGVMKRGQLRDTVFQGSFFGINAQQGNNFDRIPETGLPLACFFDNRGSGYDISFLKTDPNPTPARMEEMGRVWPEMELTRSVARMRFLFCKATGMNNVHIDSVRLFNIGQIDEGIIPSKTYVFPREDASDISIPYGAVYESFTWGSYFSGLVENIGAMNDPTILCSFSETMRDMSAQYYDTYVQTLVEAGSVTQKLAYLRESDLPVRGEIYYNGVRREGVLVTPSKVKTFDMAGLDFPIRTNFHRNHSWTVYGYMIGQHMEVDVRVDDWVVPWSEQQVTILDTATVNVDQDGKFITDAPMQADSLRYDDGVVKLKEPIENGKPEKKWFNVPVPAGNGVTGRVVIYAPENGILHVNAVPVDSVEFWPRLDPATEGNNSDAANYFDISLTRNVISREIDQNSQIPGLIGITVKRKGSPTAKKAIKLTFTIETAGGQLIAADSELIDDEYHFVFTPTP